MTQSYKDIKIEEPLTAFGQLITAEETPVVQIDAAQGLKTKQEVEVFTGTEQIGTSGTVDVVDTGTGFEWRCQTGTAVGGYGLVRSQHAVKYGPGQGTVLRFTARFDSANAVALSTQRAGGVTLGNELTFGYNGTEFGILVRSSGKPEIRKLQITTPAAGNETLTITLNGTAFNTDVTSGTAQHNAHEISAATATFTGWDVWHNDDTVFFQAESVDAKSGTYSVSSTGALDGTFSQVAAGASVNDTWIYQDDWNVNTMKGKGPFPMTLDPSKGNIYEIRMQYLGYGNIHFFIENPSDGRMELVHRLQYAGNQDSPSITQPEFKLGVFAASLGSTTNITCYAASLYGANQGRIVRTKEPDSDANTQTSVGTTSTNVLAVRVRKEINGINNLRDVIPMLCTYAVDGTKPAVIEVIINPTFTGDQDWQYHHNDQTDDLLEVMTSALTTAFNDGVSLEVAAFAVGKTGSGSFDLTPLEIYLKRGDVLCIAARATSGTTDATCSLGWKED